MKKCPFCGYTNYDTATACRKCDSAFVVESATIYRGRTHILGALRGRWIRSHALCMVVLGLLVKVYWGGYGPWPTIDSPSLVTLRGYLEPLLIYGGAAFYLFGWIAPFI
jgi:hypothetical protein